VRTTIDIPDATFRRTKAEAAVRGVSLKTLIIMAVERELGSPQAVKPVRPPKPPVIHLSRGRKLDLAGFDFDDLLA